MAPADANDPDLASVRAALALAEAAESDTAPFERRLAANPNDHEARFELAKALAGAGKFQQAADQLLTIVEKDRDWNDGAARQAAPDRVRSRRPGFRCRQDRAAQTVLAAVFVRGLPHGRDLRPRSRPAAGDPRLSARRGPAPAARLPAAEHLRAALPEHGGRRHGRRSADRHGADARGRRPEPAHAGAGRLRRPHHQLRRDLRRALPDHPDRHLPLPPRAPNCRCIRPIARCEPTSPVSRAT